MNLSLYRFYRTTFTILVERSSKYADKHNRKLEIIYENSGKKEDRDIVKYLRELKKTGNPFNTNTSKGYNPFSADDYARVIIWEPKRKTKQNPLLQIADLMLFPMAESGYDAKYYPFQKLKENKKIIDCIISPEESPYMAIKYSCFDGI